MTLKNISGQPVAPPTTVGVPSKASVATTPSQIKQREISTSGGTVDGPRTGGALGSDAAAKVVLSPKAQELKMAKDIFDKTQDVRMDKVEHYKKLIESGQYKPNAQNIAHGIAREAIRDELSKNPEMAMV